MVAVVVVIAVVVVVVVELVVVVVVVAVVFSTRTYHLSAQFLTSHLLSFCPAQSCLFDNNCTALNR